MYDCPSLVGPELINRTQIEFYCDVMTNETDSAARFIVSFLFDYEQDDEVPGQVVTADNPRATLHERYLANRLNKRVSVGTGATLLCYLSSIMLSIYNSNNNNNNNNNKLCARPHIMPPPMYAARCGPAPAHTRLTHVAPCLH